MNLNRWEYFVGLDLGQICDYTAIAVLEQAVSCDGKRDPVTYNVIYDTTFWLRYLERVPLGTDYPMVVDIVVDVVEKLALLGPCTLVVDSTGVGAPVVDLLKRARLKARMVPVMITGGNAASRGPRGDWRVPKRDLVTGLQVMLQMEQLQIVSGLRDEDALVKELREMVVKVNFGGRESFEALRNGGHDDLVVAVGLACWRSRFGKR